MFLLVECDRPIAQIPHCTSPIPHKCTIQNINVHISVLNGALRDMEQMHCVTCEIGLLQVHPCEEVFGIIFSIKFDQDPKLATHRV